MFEKFKACMRDEEGQGMTEYILIVVLIAIAAIAAFIYFRGILKDKVNGAGDDLEGAT